MTIPTPSATDDLRLQKILGDVSAAFLDYVGTDEAEPLRRVVDLIVAGLGDWCAFSLVGEDEILREVASHHPNPRQRELAARVRELLPPGRWDAGTAENNPLVAGRTLHFEEITHEMLRAGLPTEELFELYREIDLSALIIAPMRSAGQPVGMLTLALTGGRHFPPGAVDFVEAVASRATLAVRNARLARELSRERDAAARRAAELEAVLSSHPLGVAIVDSEERLKFVSPQLAQLTGVDVTDQLGRHVHDVWSEHVVALVAPQPSNLAELLEKRDRSTQDDLRLANGRVLQRRSTPVRGPDGAYLGRLLLYDDVTAERDLDRQRREFLSVASHELRTPLTSISLHLQTAARRLAAGGVIDATLVQRARRQTERLGELIDDMLSLSRLESGRFELNLAPLELGAFVRECAGDLASVASQEVVLDFRDEPLPVRADRARLTQVVANLLQNAFKYSPPDTKVVVEARREGREAVLAVTDRGIGIPAADLARLFEPFFRARNASTASFGGLGLGLYISSEIVRRHGGTFEVTSEEGKGSTFRVRLPLADA